MSTEIQISVNCVFTEMHAINRLEPLEMTLMWSEQSDIELLV
jgi:hypothetical protein